MAWLPFQKANMYFTQDGFIDSRKNGCFNKNEG